jgi:uncharacterized membrane protein YqaE (UPF0057 family)
LRTTHNARAVSSLPYFLPPVAVLVTEGIGLQFLLNILLTLLGGIPGMIHAIWIIMRSR